MLWVLWDIVLPLVGTFLLGLFIGWLLWRWRRSRIGAEGISTLRRSSARYKADVERLQQSNIELSDRLQAASGASGGDLANANKRIDMLAEELKSSRREVAELKKTDRDSGGSGAFERKRILQLEAQLQEARQVTDARSAQPNEMADLQREIEARDRMIVTLRNSLDQFGEHGGATVLMADVALRDRKIDELQRKLDESLKR